MVDRLFYASLHAWWSNALQNAASDVRQLHRSIFLSPNLSGELRKIETKYVLEIAKLQPSRMNGQRKQRHRETQDAWGDVVTVINSDIEVTVPFEGSKESFHLMPSYSLMLNKHVSLGARSITFSVTDDGNTQNNVDQIIAQITQNLDTLRADFEKLRPQLTRVIADASEEMKRKIFAENERDKKLSFPVSG